MCISRHRVFEEYQYADNQKHFKETHHKSGLTVKQLLFSQDLTKLATKRARHKISRHLFIRTNNHFNNSNLYSSSNNHNNFNNQTSFNRSSNQIHNNFNNNSSSSNNNNNKDSPKHNNRSNFNSGNHKRLKNLNTPLLIT